MPSRATVNAAWPPAWMATLPNRSSSIWCSRRSNACAALLPPLLPFRGAPSRRWPGWMATWNCCAKSRPSFWRNTLRLWSICAPPCSKGISRLCGRRSTCCRENSPISPWTRRWRNCRSCANWCMRRNWSRPLFPCKGLRRNWTDCVPTCWSLLRCNMKVLVAEDDAFYSRILQSVLRDEYEVLIAEDGNRAWEMLQAQEAPRLALLDWQMPGLDGLEVCRKVRANPAMDGFYLVIATVRQSLDDVLAGFEAGANDYITKPFHAQELRARLRVGRRVIELQAALASRVAQLQDALSRVKQLQGLLPICSYCKRIRDDHDYWQQMETYMGEHSQATFTHGICPECYEKFFKAELEELRRGK